MNQPISVQNYPGQLSRWVSLFAAGRFQDFEGALDDRSSTQDVRRFLVNSIGNRLTWLLRETASLADVLDDHTGLIQGYIQAVPRPRYEIAGPGDEELLLRWLLEKQPLTAVQRDFVTCQLGEFAVATEGRKNRSGHIQFQKMAAQSSEQVTRLGVDPGLCIHLNPIRFAAQLFTEGVVGAGRPLPADILFFAQGTSVRAILLSETEAAAIRTLAALGSCTLAEWIGTGREAHRAHYLTLARDLGEQRLVAFE